jgi:arylsulfatase A-like enzyme/HEAT repeat protein
VLKSLLQHLLAGALGGVGSGLLATAFEIAALPTAEMSARLVGVVAGTIVPAFFAAGAVLGLVLGLVRAAAAALAGRLARARSERARRIAADALVGLLLGGAGAPVTLLLLAELAHGRKASQVLGALWVRALVTVAVALGAALATYFGINLARRTASTPRGRWLALGLGLGLAGSAFAMFQADDGLYVRLYLSLHLVLLLGYQVAGTLATLALWLALRSRGDAPARAGRGRWLALGVCAALLAASVPLSRRALRSDQHLRYCVLELSTASSKLLGFLPLEVRSEAPLFLDGAAAPWGGKGSRRGYTVRDANVIIVSIDALRPDHLGAYGYARPTSLNIDALAARSIRFESAYTQVPLTCYAVPSLLTGDYLRSTLPFLTKSPPTLARILAGRGYTTAAFYNSSMFFCDDQRAMAYGQQSFGFEYAETTLRAARELTDQVLDYITEFRRAGKRKLMLWVHYFDVHEPYEQHPGFRFGNRTIDRYDAEIAYVDHAVGRLLAGVSQLLGPTIFVLTSDHGEEFKEHGGYYHGSSLYEEQTRVPLLIGVTGLPPRVERAPAQLVDVAPTVLALLGVRAPETVRGRSLVPSLIGRGDPDRTAFAEVHTKKMVRHRNWKLIHDYRRSTYELYDLATDPLERSNLIARRPVEAARLRGHLDRWFDQIRAVARRRDASRPEALDLGSVGDRRAVPLLAALLNDPRAESRWRQEAARLLGQLQDASVGGQLWLAVGDDDERVAAESAIALGEIKDRRARAVLPQILRTTQLELRTRAGIALGRVDSGEATPALIQGLYSPNWEIQNRAAHYLGVVGDRRAVEPLLRASTWQHLRPRSCLALGRVGRRIRDRRILDRLLGLARGDPHAEVRQRALTGLGFLGDRRAIRPLARLLAEEPELIWTAEALARIGGIGSYWLPGLDFTPARRGLSKEGWGRCVDTANIQSDEFHESTWCAMSAPTASLVMSLPRKPLSGDLTLRVRPIDPRARGGSLALTVNSTRLPAVKLAGGWYSYHWESDARQWRQGKNLVRLQLTVRAPSAHAPDGLLAVDHLLLVPPR